MGDEASHDSKSVPCTYSGSTTVVKAVVWTAALRKELRISLAVLPNQIVLTPGRPVPAPTLYRQAPGSAATGVSALRQWYDSTWARMNHKVVRHYFQSCQ